MEDTDPHFMAQLMHRIREMDNGTLDPIVGKSAEKKANLHRAEKFLSDLPS